MFSQLTIDNLYLNFQREVNAVPHYELLCKINKVGIKGKICKYIESWLRNLHQGAAITSNTSKRTSVRSRIHDGLVLGPMLLITQDNKMLKISVA